MLDTLERGLGGRTTVGRASGPTASVTLPRPVHQVRRLPAGDHQAPRRWARGRDPRSGRACRPHPDQAGLRHRDHRADEPARPPEPLLLEVGERQALDRQVVHHRDGNIWFERTEHTWSDGPVQVLRREPRRRYERGGRPGDARLRVHPHRRHQGSDRRAVWRRHEVRRHHRQPAVPARRRRAWARAPRRSTSCSSSRRRRWSPRF